MGRIKTRFSDFKIKSKLYTLIFLFVASLIICGVVFRNLLISSQTLTILVNEEREFIENFEKGVEYFYNYQLIQDPQNLQKSLHHFDRARDIAFTFAKVDSLIKTMSRDEWIPYFFDVFKEGVDNDLDKLEIMIEQIIVLTRLYPEKLDEVQQIALEASKHTDFVISQIELNNKDITTNELAELDASFQKIHILTRSFASEIYNLNEDVSGALLFMMVVLIIIFGTISLIIAAKISNSVSVPINNLVHNFKKIAKGNLKSSVNIDSKNEIGELSNAFLEIQLGLQNIIAYSKELAGGNYDVTLKPKSKHDELTIALNEMAKKLNDAKIHTEKESWLQKGLSGLDDKIRGNFSVRELSDRIITYLGNFLNAEMGAIYVFDEVKGHLELTGSVGINTNDVKEKIKPGEGLIGKTALDNSLQILNPTEKYHKTYSATGEMFPAKIYLLPMHYNERIQAVIELAPLNELSGTKIEFLKLIAGRLPVNLGAAVARYRNNELLDKTLEQAETLKQREEELSKQLEENKAIHENLTREKALLDSMLRIIPDFIHFKDLDSNFLRISESLVDFLGAKTSKELIGKSDFDLYSRKEAKKYFDEEQKMIESGNGVVDHLNHDIDKDGNERWSSVTKLPMYDETGKCIGTFGISKNVTDIKKLESEIKNQNEKLQANQEKLEKTIEEMHVIQQELEREKTLMDSLLDSSPDAIYFKDLESKFIKVSSSMPQLFNLDKPEELYGKSDFDFFTREHALPAYNDEQRIIKTKQPIIGKVERDTFKDGSERYVSSTKMPLINRNGEVIGTFGISRDITKIKKLELEVKERNEKLNAQKEELKSINEELKAQEEELRVANEELAEQTKVLTENEKSLQVQQEELRVTNEELEAKTRELEQRQKEISEKNDNLLKTQKELKQKAEELKRASQYKSEFLANMSHELRTPLNSMLILSKLLGNNKHRNLTDDQVKSVNIIHKSGKDLLDLINEILDLSKIEAGKMTYEFNEVNISEVIAEINQGFKPVAESKGLELIVNKTAKFPDKLYTDKQRLQQIIKNLLSNAFKFTSSGGVKVNFGLPKANTVFNNGRLNHKNSCFISVEDTGVGIPKDKLEAIFEAFQQADGSISRKFGGTGLGLSISKQLISVLGGEIHVESVEGSGSSFIIYLPLDKSLAAPETEPENKKEKKTEEKTERQTDNRYEEKIPSENSKNEISEAKAPYFVDDDRNKEINWLLVLIIHNEKAKAKKLVELCHNRKFNAIVAASIPDGIKLAEKYSPQAIIISAELNDSEKIKNLKENKATNRLPLHLVSRIEDSVLENIEELKTPESDDFENVSKNIEKKLNGEFRQVLVVEDNEVTRRSIQMLFENKDIIIHEAKTGQQAYDMISTKPFDCIILDLGLPDFSGNELLKKLKSDKIPIPNVIIHTARELNSKELRELHKYSDSIVIKGIKSDERLMDEVTLFLHQVKNSVPESSHMAGEPDDDEQGFKGKKVLIVDDDIRNIFALAQILEEKEIEILEAENGEMAIDVLKQNPGIDLVLMDIMMPVMDGYEAMKIIRQTPEIDDTPIITLTAKAMKEDYQKAIDNGANDYISKPVDTDKLISLLKIWLFR